MNVGTVGFSPETAFYLPHTRFWELMMGSVLAHISLYRHDEFEVKLNRKFRVPFSGFELPFREIMAGLGICFILAGVVFLDKASPFPGYWALLPTGGAFFSIAAGPRTWINRNILSCRFMIFVGVISYPLYLWHWPLLSFARIVEAGEPSLAVKLAAVALAVLLAWLTYQLVEKRIRFGMTGSGTRRVVLLLASGMAVAFGVGVVTVKTHGLPRRYPDAIRRLSQYKAEEHASSWRDGKCFLQPDQDWHKFDTSCYDVQPQSAPLLLLWGDSHAADLYPGLKHLQSDYTFRIAQYTSSFCPPIFNFKNPQRKLCENNNIWLRRQIQELHPQIVVLAAQYWFLDSPDVHNKISSTLAILKKAGVQTVIVVGPNPEWKEPLPRALFDSYYRATSFHTIPDRMLYQLDDSIFPIDRRLRTWVSESDASYVSPVGILCNQTGCLTQLHESGTSELTSFDRHHLTDRASQYVAKLMFAPLFTQVSPRIPMK